MQQRLGAFDMGILNGRKLQAGSNTQEYRKFLRILDATGIRPHAAKALTLGQTPGWAIHLGMGCALLSVCCIGGQLWYNGSRVLGTRGASISLGTFGKVLCCGTTALLVRTDYNPVGRLRKDPEESQDQKENSIKMGVAWTNGNPDTRERAEMIVAEELEEFANGSVN